MKTRWTAPRTGVTVRELINSIPSGDTFRLPIGWRRWEMNQDARTDLDLTGADLQSYDLARIEEALRRVREEGR